MSRRRTPSGLLVRAVAMVAFATVVALVGSQVGDRGGWSPLDNSAGATGDHADLRFVDVAGELGLNFHHGAFRWGLSPDPVAMMGGGLCWIDYDDDGWLDLFAVNTYAEAEWSVWQEAGGLPTSRLFRNHGTGFTDVTDLTNAGLAVRGLGCVAGDIDSDGDTDLYVTSATSNALLLNGGDGTFSEVAAASGVDAYGWHASAAMGDLDGDGLIDLFVTGYVNLIRPFESPSQGFPRTYEALGDLVFRNLGLDESGTPIFSEVGTEAGLEPSGYSYGLGSVMTDVDMDGDLDIYVANDTDPNQLYLNHSSEGVIVLVESGDPSGVDDEFSGMGVAAADLDRNGSPDLTVTNLDYQLHGIFANRGAGAFAPIGESSGISDLEGEYTGWGVSGADFDLDTDLDVVIVNGNIPVMYPEADRQPIQLFESRIAQGDVLAFAAAGGRAGLSEIGPIIGRSAAVADFDNDGDPDIAITQISGPVLLLRNESTGNTLTVEFETFAPGAHATVRLSDGTELVRESHAGTSYLSSEDPRMFFGLGEFEQVDSLVVDTGDRIHRFSDVPSNGVVSIP